MARVFLGLGSNVERERYLTAGLDALHALFGELALSPVYESEAIGYDGQPFLNMVVSVETDLPLAELARRLRHIETEHGRPEHATPSTPRQLDIDILTYDDLVGDIDGVELPRGEILENAFVLRPLADLAPDALHPVDGRTYRELWAAYDQESQRLVPVAFSWRGRLVGKVPTVLRVETKGDHTLLVTFSNQVRKSYDIQPLLSREAFAPLRTPAFFKAVTVEPGGYAVAWGGDIDISEYELWRHGKLLE